jgi:hypothetical protein
MGRLPSAKLSPDFAARLDLLLLLHGFLLLPASICAMLAVGYNLFGGAFSG